MTAHSSNLDPQPATAPTPDPESDAEAADFLERLGDLDQFIGGATGSPEVELAPFSGPRNASQPSTRRLFEARVATPDGRSGEQPADQSDEQSDFLQRLGDLDRFISPGQADAASPAGPAPTTPPTASTDDEAADFLQRLSDLDRFIGPGA